MPVDHSAAWGGPGWGSVGWAEVASAENPNTSYNVFHVPPKSFRSGQGGGSRETPEHLVWAICPRCGFRYRLNEMRVEIYDQRPTGRRVCPECRDEDDPHLGMARVDLTDTGLVRNNLPHNDQLQSVGMSSPLRGVRFGHPVEAVFGAFSVMVGDVMICGRHRVVLRETGEGGERYLNTTPDGNWPAHVMGVLVDN
jgi:hypothetical protein